MLNDSQGLGVHLLRGMRKWQLMALPLSIAAVIILFFDDGAGPLKPSQGLLQNTRDEVPYTDALAQDSEVTWMYLDPGRGQAGTLRTSLPAWRESGEEVGAPKAAVLVEGELRAAD